MEKYIIFLTLIAILLFALCTFPVLGYTADNTYVLCPNTAYAECVLESAPAWRTHDYVVFLISAADTSKAKTIPHGKVVQEYLFKNEHTMPMCNPFLQSITANGITTVGLPYIIVN